MIALYLAVVLLQLAPFGFLALAFRPHPNGAELGGYRYAEWPEEQEHPEYA